MCQAWQKLSGLVWRGAAHVKAWIVRGSKWLGHGAAHVKAWIVRGSNWLGRGAARFKARIVRGSKWLGRGALHLAAGFWRSADPAMRRLYRWPWLLVPVAVYATLISAIWQLNQAGLAAYLFSGGLVLWGCAYPKFGVVLISAGLLWVIYSFAGSSDPLADVVLLVAALAISLAIVSLVARKSKTPLFTDRRVLLIACLFFIAGWGLLSLTDAIFGPDYASVEQQSDGVSTQPSKWPDVKVGLALSGGGYRAGLFHAGVLAGLRDLGVPVEVISSVSGASIMASFYARGGTPEQFLQDVIAGSFNLRREMLRLDHALCFIASSRIPVGYGSFKLVPFAPECTRTKLQANLLDKILLGDALFQEGSVPGRPEVMLDITDLAGGRMLGVTQHGVVNLWLKSPLERLEFDNPAGIGGASLNAAFFPEWLINLPGDHRLSVFVAASGAFPGALPAYRLWAPYTLSDPPGGFAYLLADGGLADNTGLVLLDAAQLVAREEAEFAAHPRQTQNPPSTWNMSRWDVDVILASDGSALSPEEIPFGAFDEFVRAMDVMYMTTGGKEAFAQRDEKAFPRSPTLFLSPRSFAEDPADMQPGKPVVRLGKGLALGSMPSDLLPEMGFSAMDAETLSFVSAHMPADAQKEATALEDDLLQRGVLTPGGWTHLDLSGNSPEHRLYGLVARELDRRLRAFIETPTLRDHIDAEAATSIFDLGEYIVRFNKSYIECFLGRAHEIKELGEDHVKRHCATLFGSLRFVPGVTRIYP
jgi:predicted acylesterase/phospholipase RssA